ncbi:MAG TPA: hypothetical protein VK871_12640, partial [Candidatus Limnocylindrales bacterium]|nr:hypothetical protein [Candidatus Limnocylindrales bacterium]
MSRRPFAARFVTIATLAALATGMVGTTIVQARSPQAPDRQLRIADDPARESAGVRSFRHVDVAALPAPSGRTTPFEPDLGVPEGFGEAAPPDVAGVLGPVFATANADPVIDEATSYAGLARVAGTPEVPSSTDGEPPDPWVATGPEHVFQAVNTEFRVTDRAGNELASADMFDFFGLGQFYEPGEVAYFDPRVIYDSLHQRWVAVEASFDCFVQSPSTVGTGYIDIAISDGPDPTAGWGVLSIAYSDALPDYPGLGTSTDKVVTSANVFALDVGGDLGCEPVGGPGFLGTEMDVMAWSELIGSGAVNIDFLYSTNNFPNNFFSWRPALQTPATSSTVFAIAERNDEDVAYARINGSPAAGGVTTIAVSNLAAVIGPFAEAPPPMQPGSPATIVRAYDARPTDAVWMNNRLAFVSTYPCDPDGPTVGEERACVRVSELSTATPASPTLIQDFLIGEDGADLYMGGVGYALNGTLHAVWTRSSEDAGQYASSYAAYQTPNVIDNSISDIALLSAGSGTYEGERWGDYVGVAQDPQVPNAVWQGNQYSTGGTWGWATEVSQLQTGGTSYVPIEPVRVLDTRPAFSIGLVGAFA